MKLIVGLGNPGQEYKNTRHNLGFMVLELLGRISSEARFSTNAKFHGEFLETSKLGKKFILLKPTTFMNNSGKSVAALANFYNLPPEDIWVIYDELALNFGQMRIRQGGGSAGHNGIKSISQSVGEDFFRFRIGINNNLTDKTPSEKFVLSRFTQLEREQLPDLCSQACQIILHSLEDTPKQTSYNLLAVNQE